MSYSRVANKIERLSRILTQEGAFITILISGTTPLSVSWFLIAFGNSQTDMRSTPSTGSNEYWFHAVTTSVVLVVLLSRATQGPVSLLLLL